MKNILFTYITPFHPERGGIGRVTHSLTLELQARGYQVFYLIYESAITIKHEYNYPAPLEYLPSSELLSHENLNFYHNFLKKHAIDIVINQSGNFSDSMLYVDKGEGNDSVKVISVLHSSPWVAYLHLWSTIYPLKNKTLIEKFKRIIRIALYPQIKKKVKKDRINHFKQLLPKTDLVCLLSKKFFKELSEIHQGYENKYIAIPNPNTFDDKETYNTCRQSQKQLLFVGLFNSEKRVDRIIKIWNQIYKSYPEWELIILGDGTPNFSKRLKTLASKAERIYFKGFQSPLPYYQSASILCITSNFEGWPMVLTEAMQCGVVPIAFKSFASITDIIDNNQNGVLISPFNLNEYKTRLCELMNETELRENMSKQARSSIKKFNIKQVVNLWEKVF